MWLHKIFCIFACFCYKCILNYQQHLFLQKRVLGCTFRIDRSYIYYIYIYFFFKLREKLLPNPSASSKIIFISFKFYWACSIFFKQNQIFWSWSKARFYLIYLHIWAWSKIFGFIQKILNTVKSIMNMVKNNWTSRWIRHMIQSFYSIEYELKISNINAF